MDILNLPIANHAVIRAVLAILERLLIECGILLFSLTPGLCTTRNHIGVTGYLSIAAPGAMATVPIVRGRKKIMVETNLLISGD